MRVLAFPIDATFGVEPSDFTRARKELTRWIEERAATFLLVPYGNGYANSSLGEKIEGAPSGSRCIGGRSRPGCWVRGLFSSPLHRAIWRA